MEKRRTIQYAVCGVMLVAIGVVLAGNLAVRSTRANRLAVVPSDGKPSELSTSEFSTSDGLTSEFLTSDGLASDGLALVVSDVHRDGNIRLCQGFDHLYPVQNSGSTRAVSAVFQTSEESGVACEQCQDSGFGYGEQVRNVWGVDQNTRNRHGHEPRWRNGSSVPWESLAYGEYLGPHRTPHVAEYRLRVNDQLEFVFIRTREKSLYPYRMFVGDTIDISSAIDESLDQTEMTVRSDGKVSLALIGQMLVAGKTVEQLTLELNEAYSEYVKNPSIVVRVRDGDKPLDDIVDSVDARAGQGGQGRAAVVSPDGTVQLPGIGNVPAIGLTLDEIAREVNARYRLRQGGLEVTPILTQRAPRFIYVVGEANRSGRFELTGPTTVMQAIAMAEGFRQGGNLRQVVVFRRDQNWRLTATKLDLAGALYGKRPHPSDEIWLRDSDIILIPKKPIQRLSEAVDLYLTNTLYSIFPRQALGLNFDGVTPL